MNIACVITVKGRVQGVGFRYFVRQHALHFGLFGYVKNLYNGDVEVVVEGDEKIIQPFTEKLKNGPHYGEVSELTIEHVPFEERFDKFEVRF